MPKKKGPTHISFRLKPVELEPLDADRKALPGVPVARNTYARHAVLSYPKLRKLEEAVRAIKNGAEGIENAVRARRILEEAGL